MRKAAASIASILILAMALAIPGGAHVAQAAAGNQIRIATLAPRDTDLARGFAKIDKGLQAATGGQWGIRLYPSGVAGDEKDVIRKMRIGQMDASVITTTGLSQIVREVAVLDTPGVINSYPELERVQKTMLTEWNQTFDKAGFKLFAWGETGQYRYFSKGAVKSPNDLKTKRPWLWPESYVLREIYHVLGVTGVPLGVPEVYGALQTGMVDALVSTSLATVALQWHSKLDHVTKDTFGVLLGAMIMNGEKWKGIPEDVKTALEEQIRQNTEGNAQGVRKDDDKAYNALLKRGYTATSYTPEGNKAYQELAAGVRKRMVGRVYPQALLDRVMGIAAGKGK
jgi:TRAP-type C4-dicarboxylate transport system substrate-binding protein